MRVNRILANHSIIYRKDQDSLDLTVETRTLKPAVKDRDKKAGTIRKKLLTGKEKKKEKKIVTFRILSSLRSILFSGPLDIYNTYPRLLL